MARTVTNSTRRTAPPPTAMPAMSPTVKDWGSDAVMLVAVVVAEMVVTEFSVGIESVKSLLLTASVGGDSVAGGSVAGLAAEK